ncbi:MAG: hypothetical protein M3Y72_09975 [Acidobacteriota bacterium]|nr:hypothetical protein [Acidobacteriota bacterium]
MDALYRHYRVSGAGLSSDLTQREFPLLLKYKFEGVPLVRPFVDGGPIFEYVSHPAFPTVESSSSGIALGAGLGFHALFIHVTPEFRYIHWSATHVIPNPATVLTNQNQAEFLVGLTF